LRLVDDVLDLARIEARGITVSPEPIAVHALVDEVLAGLAESARAAGVTLTPPEVPEDLPMVHADRVRFAQVLMNLGSNAIKYNRHGGSMMVTVVPTERGVRVTVSDDGIGVAPEHQARLFEAFHRAGQETGPIEGTGIGLALSKRLAELMSGSMGYRPRAAGGSEFWVELPAHRSGARSSRVSSPGLVAAGATPQAALARSRVLYVEDNAANVALVREIVTSLDRTEFFAAHTAESGLALARQMRPDVVLMDINLPGMNGYEALAALHGAKETADIPVIAVSAAALSTDRTRAARAGFAHYVTKPIRIDELETALSDVLQKVRGAPRGA
jgi:CheY-like chemotaxis protein